MKFASTGWAIVAGIPNEGVLCQTCFFDGLHNRTDSFVNLGDIAKVLLQLGVILWAIKINESWVRVNRTVRLVEPDCHEEWLVCLVVLSEPTVDVFSNNLRSVTFDRPDWLPIAKEIIWVLV